MVKYTYDALNRLIREDNRQLGKTVLWTYDNFGNILYKRTTAYTVKAIEEIETFDEEKEYLYDGKYPDRLVGFGDDTITYNTNGMPTSYRGKTLDWNGLNQLMSVDGTTTTFGYDGSGRCIKKGDIIFTYDFSGRLVKSNGFEFYYDGSGLSGFKYNNQKYIYRKNLQGDITQILDNSGNTVVKYSYDAWGNHTTTDTSGLNLGNLNPFRYRSYYYDTETGLYYLQTRYYDPETGRFISQDDVSYLNAETVNGLNLYAYCFNNPVMMVDPLG